MEQDPVITYAGEAEYHVEKIVNKKMIGGEVHYRVKWVGWESAHNTWEPIGNLQNCIAMVEEYDFKKCGVSKPTPLMPEEVLQKQMRRTMKTKLDDANQQNGNAEFLDQLEHLDVDDDHRHNAMEDMEQDVFGPLFRRTWKREEVPVAIVGSAIFRGVYFHLVRIVGPSELYYTLMNADPFDGITEKNVVIVLNSYFRCQFPQLVIRYYESNMVMYDNKQSDDVIAEKAARVVLQHQLKPSDKNRRRKTLKDTDMMKSNVWYLADSDDSISKNSSDDDSDAYEEVAI